MEKLKDIILKLFKLENIAFNLTGYVETKLELFKLEIRTDVAKAVARAVAIMFLGFLGFLFLLFLSLGLAFLINSLVDVPYLGFFVVAIAYGGAFVLLLLNRKKFAAGIEDQLLKSQNKKSID